MLASAPRKSILAAAALLAVVGCGAESAEVAGDGENDPFGIGKADGQFSDCQLEKVLEFVNDPATTVDALRNIGLRSNAGANIIEHRDGPDGQAGTADDNLFDDIEELDAVPFVGPVSLDALVMTAADGCDSGIESRPFIDDQTFANGVGGGFSRDSAELEAAMTVTGISGAELNRLLTETDANGRTGFRRLRRTNGVEGLTYGYDIDEVPWSRSSMEAREALPYVPLTIEFGRFDAEDGGQRELSLGTDINDDTYFDTANFDLLENDISLRGRIRWDGIDVVRRLLVAAKFNSAVDAGGIKRAEKIDVRTEGGNHKDTLVDDVRNGIARWSGSARGLEPVRAVYEALADADVLKDVDGHSDVLLLDPMAQLRSTRSRFHFDYASTNEVRDYHDNGRERIGQALEMARTALDAGVVDAGDAADVEELILFGEGILDASIIAQRAEAGLTALDPNLTVTAADIVLPSDFPSTVGDHLELETNRVVSEVVDTLYHEFSDRLDDLDRDITGTRGLDFDEFVDMFEAWQISEDASLARKTVHQPFLDIHRDIAALPDADREASFEAFNAFAEAELAAGNDDFEDFEPLGQESFDALGRHLEFEVLKIAQRQIAAAGIVANSLWFETAREFYVPNSSRPFGNFLIDTIDFTQMVASSDWDAIPEADRGIDQDIDPSVVFHATLVNEVQIELGLEDDYLARIDELQARVDDGSATDEEIRDLDGAQMVLGELQGSLAAVAALKGDEVLDELDDSGAPNGIGWGPSEHSKGTTALKLLSGTL